MSHSRCLNINPIFKIAIASYKLMDIQKRLICSEVQFSEVSVNIFTLWNQGWRNTVPTSLIWPIINKNDKYQSIKPLQSLLLYILVSYITRLVTCTLELTLGKFYWILCPQPQNLPLYLMYLYHLFQFINTHKTFRLHPSKMFLS